MISSQDSSFEELHPASTWISFSSSSRFVLLVPRSIDSTFLPSIVLKFSWIWFSFDGDSRYGMAMKSILP